MNVCVTGGAGFIGSHFIRQWRVRHPKDQIVNFDALTYAGSSARVADVEGGGSYRFVQGTICDPEIVQRALSGCELIVHCAAETHVDRSITDATPFLRTNVEGTYHLLHAAQRTGVTRFVHISTDEVYGPILSGSVDERAPFAPQSPYAASKAAADLLVQSCHATYALPTIIVRPTNIFGPWQLPEKFIPLCVTNGMEGRAVPVYGDGQQHRGWLFVEDLCEALQLIIERGTIGEVYNVGSGTEQANVETARMILEQLGASRELLTFVKDRPAHDRRYAMNDAKLRALGWQPRTSFQQGLSKTIDWYRAHADWWRPITRRLREDSYHWLHRTPWPSAVPSPKSVA